VVLQLTALALAGGVTVDRFVVWAQIDEAQHFAYVEELAEDARLPWLGRDTVSDEVLAISHGTSPGPSPVDPAAAGLGGQSYEAFQPPLYYVLAVPAFLVAADHLDKVRVLRAFDVLLLLAAAGALWLLARQVFGPSVLLT
jgi:hypothetical protein